MHTCAHTLNPSTHAHDTHAQTLCKHFCTYVHVHMHSIQAHVHIDTHACSTRAHKQIHTCAHTLNPGMHAHARPSAHSTQACAHTHTCTHTLNPSTCVVARMCTHTTQAHTQPKHVHTGTPMHTYSTQAQLTRDRGPGTDSDKTMKRIQKAITLPSITQTQLSELLVKNG